MSFPQSPAASEQVRLSLHDGKPDRSGRPAGDHDPVIARPLEFRSERPAASRFAPDPRQGGFRANRKPRGPGEPAPDHRTGHHHKRALRGQGIDVQGIIIQVQLRTQRAPPDEFPAQLIVDDEIRAATCRQVDTQVPTGIPLHHGHLPCREKQKSSVEMKTGSRAAPAGSPPSPAAGKDGDTHRKNRPTRRRSKLSQIPARLQRFNDHHESMIDQASDLSFAEGERKGRQGEGLEAVPFIEDLGKKEPRWGRRALCGEL